MIKSINDLTEKEIDILKRGPVEVIEMLDCMRFKVIFTKDTIEIKSAKGKVIDEIDCLVNNFHRDVTSFCYDKFGSMRDQIYDTFGECEVTMMYMPEQKFNKIAYDNYKGIRFIFCAMFTKNKDLKDEDKFLDMCPFIEPYPCIDILQDVDSFDIDNIINVPTFSGNSVDSIEGVILRCRNVKCKIVITDTTSDIDPYTKKIYRDIVLEDFSKIIGEAMINRDFFDDNDDYVTCVCNMFYEYVNSTELFRKFYVEPEDLLPPSLGNVGDIDLRYIPSTARLFCSHKLYMNILRLLLVTFKTDDMSRFDTFNERVRENLMRIFRKINNL